MEVSPATDYFCGMAALSIEQARELIKASTGGKGSKISVPLGTLERIQGVNPPPKQENAPKRGKMGNVKVPDPVVFVAPAIPRGPMAWGA